MPEERKTFTEWEASYGIALLHVDKEDLLTPDGRPLMMTGTEFEQRVVGYLERRREHDNAGEFRRTDEVSATVEAMYSDIDPATSENRSSDRHRTENHRMNNHRIEKHRIPMRYMAWLLVLATFPTLITLLVSGSVRLFSRFIRIRWQISAAVLFADLIVLLIRPVGALLAGPGYLWYQVLNFAYTFSTRGWVIAQHVLLNRSLNFIGGNHPLFWSVSAGGSPLPLYFVLGEAVVSSLFWATTLVFTKALYWDLREVRQMSSAAAEE